jgi:hypothetical protein
VPDPLRTDSACLNARRASAGSRSRRRPATRRDQAMQGRRPTRATPRPGTPAMEVRCTLQRVDDPDLGRRRGCLRGLPRRRMGLQRGRDLASQVVGRRERVAHEGVALQRLEVLQRSDAVEHLRDTRGIGDHGRIDEEVLLCRLRPGCSSSTITVGSTRRSCSVGFVQGARRRRSRTAP